MSEFNLGTIIKVVGVGGAGGNAVTHMVKKGVPGVEFVAANTDAQVLNQTGADVLIQLGNNGLGAGANPEVGKLCAEEQKEVIKKSLEGCNMVFVTAGMGGGTGTGAAPVVAQIAREMNILTVGVVSKPFEFEGPRRMKIAESGIDELEKHVDSLIVILNSRLEETLGDDVTQKEAFECADDVLYSAVNGIAEIINRPGLVNVDFQDVRTVMGAMGMCLMGSALATGPERARNAAEKAVSCPLLEGANLQGARGILVNVSGSADSLKLRETKEVLNIIRRYASEDAQIIFGAVYDDALGDAVRVTVVASGLGKSNNARNLRDVRVSEQQQFGQYGKNPMNTGHHGHPSQAGYPGYVGQPHHYPDNSVGQGFEKPHGGSTVAPMHREGYERQEPGMNSSSKGQQPVPDVFKSPRDINGAEKWDIPAFLRRQANGTPKK